MYTIKCHIMALTKPDYKPDNHITVPDIQTDMQQIECPWLTDFILVWEYLPLQHNISKLL